MASHEDQAEEIVADLLFDRRVYVLSFLSALDVTSDLFVLALERLAAPDQVDRAVLRCPDEPCARPFRHSFGGQLFERVAKGVVCELLGSPDVPDDASQPRDEPGRLYAPDR